MKWNAPAARPLTTPKTSTALNAAPSLGNGANLPASLETPTLGDRLFAEFDQRLAAGLLDLIPVILLYWVMGLFLTIATRLAGLDVPLPVWAELLVELYLPALAYGVLLVRFYSASAGKRILGIQVVRSRRITGWLGPRLRARTRKVFTVVSGRRINGGSENR